MTYSNDLQELVELALDNASRLSAIARNRKLLERKRNIRSAYLLIEKDLKKAFKQLLPYILEEPILTYLSIKKRPFRNARRIAINVSLDGTGLEKRIIPKLEDMQHACMNLVFQGTVIRERNGKSGTYRISPFDRETRSKLGELLYSVSGGDIIEGMAYADSVAFMITYFNKWPDAKDAPRLSSYLVGRNLPLDRYEVEDFLDRLVNLEILEKDGLGKYIVGLAYPLDMLKPALKDEA